MTKVNHTPLMTLTLAMVDAITNMNEQLAKVAPCEFCDGCGTSHTDYRGIPVPCSDCWGKGWDIDNLPNQGATNADN